MDILAANRLARAFYCDVYADTRRPPNIARFTFLDPAGERFYPDWDSAADICVAILRTEAGRNPHDRQLHDLVGELSTRSDDFRTRWGSHNVRHHGTGTKRFHHPVVGELTLAYEGLEMAAEPGLTLTIYTAEPGSASEERLRLLGSWAATHASRHRRRSHRERADDSRTRHGDASSSPDRPPASASPPPKHCSTTATTSSSTPATTNEPTPSSPLRTAGAGVVIGDLADLDETRTGSPTPSTRSGPSTPSSTTPASTPTPNPTAPSMATPACSPSTSSRPTSSPR